MTGLGDQLCAIAVDAIGGTLRDGTRPLPDLDGLEHDLRKPGATFVTLERGNRLLGCVGALEPQAPLAIDVAEHARAAAFDDPRVPPITVEDFENMSVKVSVLSPPSPLPVRTVAELRSALRVGIDGIAIEDGKRRATFLPSVWPKIRDVDDFLAALWLKAGLRPGTWPDGLRVSRYTTVEYADAGPRHFADVSSS
jgi:AmmeMemoRadiSam system protein A